MNLQGLIYFGAFQYMQAQKYKTKATLLSKRAKPPTPWVPRPPTYYARAITSTTYFCKGGGGGHFEFCFPTF